MSVVAIPAACTCGSIGNSTLRQCPVDHRLWHGDKRLTSVGSILKLWPMKACHSCGVVGWDHAAGCSVGAAIENAKRRGREVDEAFSAWVMGRASTFSVGSDSAALLKKLVDWFRKQNFSSVESQVLLSDGEVGGIADLRCDGRIIELKSVYEISQTHIIQAAAYHELMGSGANGAAILHVTDRYPEPRLRPLVQRDFDDWSTLREYWTMVQRRTA